MISGRFRIDAGKVSVETLADGCTKSGTARLANESVSIGQSNENHMSDQVSKNLFGHLCFGRLFFSARIVHQAMMSRRFWT
jgi:hypothetical protein